MVILGYLYRETHEAASIDAAWRSATQALGGQPSSRSIGTAALKSTPTNANAKAMGLPAPTHSRPAGPSSYLASLTRRATNLASTVGLNPVPDISFGATNDGSLFEFSDAQRQTAKSILDKAAAQAATSSSPSTVPDAALPGLQQNTSGSASEQSVSAKDSPEFLARGRSSSVWSSSASVTSVTQRGRNAARGDGTW